MPAQMKVAFWLGRDRSGAPRVVADPCPTLHLSKRPANDRLLADVVALCDKVHSHFDVLGDSAGRDVIDAFSIELLALVGDYLASRTAR